ncbi:hypothetical protein ACFE04_004752 [Oxalis oulophora]
MRCSLAFLLFHENNGVLEIKMWCSLAFLLFKENNGALRFGIPIVSREQWCLMDKNVVQFGIPIVSQEQWCLIKKRGVVWQEQWCQFGIPIVSREQWCLKDTIEDKFDIPIIFENSDGETLTLFPKAAKAYEFDILSSIVPIMLRSSYCTLYQNSEKELTELGEFPYDQGGYFIINASEKVLIVEVRSKAESQNRSPSTMIVQMHYRASAKAVIIRLLCGSSLSLKFSIMEDVNICSLFATLLFQALGYVDDKDILAHICYDVCDTRMELLRPWKKHLSLEI